MSFRAGRMACNGILCSGVNFFIIYQIKKNNLFNKKSTQNYFEWILKDRTNDDCLNPLLLNLNKSPYPLGIYFDPAE